VEQARVLDLRDLELALIAAIEPRAQDHQIATGIDRDAG
jgi:hypothetical protein